jgi:hypothetical protein
MAQIVKLRRSSVSGQKPTNSNLQLGELALNTTDGKVYMAKSGSLGPTVEELISTNTVNTGSLQLVGSITASAFSGSALGLINVPFQISGSDVEGNQSDKTFTKLHFDSDTGLNVSESAPGTAFISIGSHFKDIFVSGSPILSATGSDAFEIISTGGVEITTSITDTNGNGYVKELNISTTTLSSSLNNRMDTITGSITNLSSSLNSRINTISGSVNSLNTFTSSVVLTSQTSSMNVLSASYALTAAFALNAGAGGGGNSGAALGSYNSLVVTSAASTWSFEHNTGQKYPIFQVFDANGYVIIPSQIRAIDDNNAEIIFPSAQTGRVIASLGGGNGLTEAFTSSSLWTVDHNLGTDYPNVTIWDSNRNIVFPNRIESVDSNQIKIYFSQAISGNVSVSRGGHIVSGSGTVGLSDITWANLLNKPSGIVSGSSQLTGSYDTRYVLSGSITQTTWDNIANKPSGLISGSVQVELTGTTGYSTFSSSINSSVGNVVSNFNTFTSSYTTGSFTGSFKGDGSQLYNIPSTGITGLNLSRIASGSATASISPNNGLRINTNTEITGSLIVSSGSAVFDAALQLTENSSLILNSGSNLYVYDGGIISGTFKGNGALLTDLPYATTASNQFNGNQTITGSVVITQNLTVLGSSSLIYVTSSQLAVSSSTISVNVFEPAERFGGLKVYDSGSSSATASLLWDSLHNHWVYQNASGSNYSGGMLIAGPRNTGSLGDEPTLTSGRIVKSVGGDHIDNSIMSETGTTINVGGNLNANSLTGSINFNNLTNIPSLVSGSSQILYSGLTGIPSGIVSGSSQISYTGITNIPSGIVSGSEQLTGSYDTRYVLSGSITQTTWDNIANKPNDIVSSSGQIGTFGFLQTSSFNSYASTNNDRVSSLESKTGSYATTGSNSFIGTERVTGSLIVSSSLNVIGTQNVTGSLIVSNSLKVIGNENINGNLSVTGSVVISGSLDLSNANIDNSRYLHTQTTGSTTWTIVHNLNYEYPNVTVYDSDNKVMLPADVTSIDANTTQVTFATSESGHALISVGGISTSTADRFLYTASSATSSWVIDHNIGYKYVTVNVYDGADEQLIPQKITAVSINRTQIDFAAPTTGNAIITVGGPRSTSLFVQSGSFYNATTNIGITGSLVVTGDVDANNFNTTSDKKLKTNLVRIENALDKIEKLNGYTFDWLEEYSEDRTRQIGMVADEVYEVQPELISHRNIVLSNKEEKIKLLDYSKVTAILIEAIKELNDKVTKLENKKKKK